MSSKKSRRESPTLAETKDGSDGSRQVSNSALSLLQEVTAKGTEEIQALAAQPGSPETPRKSPPLAPRPEGEGVTFPERLMELVMNETDKQALWWMPEGKSFAIDSKKFTKTILAKNFQGSKFESFTRKLARWGFKRLSSPDIPPHTFVFEHPYFQRSQPELAKEISGSKKKTPPPPASGDDQGPTLGLSRAADMAQMGPTPAPWPAFGDQLQAVESNRSSAGGLYDDMIRQALLQQGLATSSNSARSDALTNQRQPDLGSRLLQSMIGQLTATPNAEENPASLRQDALITATMMANQDRARALAAASNASPSAAASRPTVDMAASLTLPSLATTNLRRSLTAGFPSSLLQQQHQSTLPSSATASLDPFVRLYLQQQETSRQENILLQQELLRQEILRREQQQREREEQGPN